MAEAEERVLGRGMSDGVDWELFFRPETTHGPMVMIRAPGGGAIGGGFSSSLSLGFGDVFIGYLGGKLDGGIVALYGVVHRSLSEVRVELADGSTFAADVVDAGEELGVNFYVAFPRTPPVRLVATHVLGHGAFYDVSELGAKFSYRGELGRGGRR